MALPTSIDTTKDTFTVTGYSAATNTATITFTVGGTAYTGVKIKGVPVDTVENIKAYLLNWAQAYLAGKNVEQNQTITPDPTVTALLNVATPFI